VTDDAIALALPSAPAAHQLLRSRRSIRHYQHGCPAPQLVERVLASAAMAPSAHNRQPWRFVVITDTEVKMRLARALGAQLMADRRRDGDPEQAIEADVARSFARMTQAPAVIVIGLTMRDMDRYPDGARNHAEYIMAVQSTAMATQNLLLAAHAEGLGTCWMCAPLFCPAEVKRALNLPEDWHPQGLVTLGFPSQTGTPKARKPLDEVVVFAGGANRTGQP
jgi:coenzyme F420-0:L-glutamate ligase / coenzyme F420-1:gamma-L-glutamate ligase